MIEILSKKCVEADGYTLEHINNQDFLNDKALALLAIENYFSVFGIISKLSDSLKNDPEVILAGLKKIEALLALHQKPCIMIEILFWNASRSMEIVLV